MKGKSLEKEKEHLLASIDQLQEENDELTEQLKQFEDSQSEVILIHSCEPSPNKVTIA